MDPNTKRRAGKLGTKLGTAKPDPELAKLSDEELLREYEREASGEAEAEREREMATRNPLFGYLQDLTDDELIAEHEAAQAQVNAATAERERGRTTPPAPVLLPVPVTVQPPDEIHAVTVPEPKAAAPQLTPRQEWDARQARMMAEAVDEARADAAREARERRRDDERPSTYDGPMLGELLRGKGNA